MKLIRQNIRLIAAAVCVLLVSLVIYGAYSISTQGSRWFASGANKYLRRAKNNVIAGNIVDRANVLLATTDNAGKRIYSSDEAVRRSMVHVVGDRDNNIAYGAESFMADYLYAFNESYLERLAQALQGKMRRGYDIRLSVDSRLSKKAYSLFPKDKSGAIVVMNYRTGELLTMQSYPNFDPMHLTQLDKDNPLKPFWNRATKWISAPGSAFKVITLAAALKNIPDAVNKTYHCSGSLELENTTITDARNAVHNDLNLKKALAVSCNIVFSQIALEIGDKNLQQTAAAFGFGDYFLFSDLVVENSVYPLTDRTEKELAWTGPGQSRLQVTPLHMCMVASAIANDGVMMEPKLLLGVTNNAGESRFNFYANQYRVALDKEAADIIADYMRETVRNGTATQAAVPGISVCGKTGSAQIDGQDETNAWFIGFIDDSKLPFAVCVVVEDAGGGGAVAAPIAGKLFQFMTGR